MSMMIIQARLAAVKEIRVEVKFWTCFKDRTHRICCRLDVGIKERRVESRMFCGFEPEKMESPLTEMEICG